MCRQQNTALLGTWWKIQEVRHYSAGQSSCPCPSAGARGREEGQEGLRREGHSHVPGGWFSSVPMRPGMRITDVSKTHHTQYWVTSQGFLMAWLTDSSELCYLIQFVGLRSPETAR